MRGLLPVTNARKNADAWRGTSSWSEDERIATGDERSHPLSPASEGEEPCARADEMEYYYEVMYFYEVLWWL